MSNEIAISFRSSEWYIPYAGRIVHTINSWPSAQLGMQPQHDHALHRLCHRTMLQPYACYAVHIAPIGLEGVPAPFSARESAGDPLRKFCGFENLHPYHSLTRRVPSRDLEPERVPSEIEMAEPYEMALDHGNVNADSNNVARQWLDYILCLRPGCGTIAG